MKGHPRQVMYHRQIDKVADAMKTQPVTLEMAGVKNCTKAPLIMATQDQALRRRLIEAWVYHTRRDPKCRQCKDAPRTAYLEHHNQVAGNLYRNINTEYGLKVPGSKWITPPNSD